VEISLKCRVEKAGQLQQRGRSSYGDISLAPDTLSRTVRRIWAGPTLHTQSGSDTLRQMQRDST